MSLSDAARAELAELVDDLQEQTLTDGRLARLNHLLSHDEDCCREYIRLTTMYTAIRSVGGDEEYGNSPGVALVLSEIAARRTRRVVASPSSCDGATPSTSPTFADTGAFGWHNTVGFFSSGWPVAYLIATVICGVSLLIGSLVPVSEPVQVARQSAPLPSPLSPLPSVVGRITGMVDCRFVEGSGFRVESSGLPSPAGRGAGGEGGSDGVHPSSFILHPSSPVSLGDKFVLASGLVEITYDTGAKVILQGPVTYEVESASGGFLSVGKLTARVEGPAASGEGGVAAVNHQSSIINHQSSNPQSPIPNPSLSTNHYPLFTIKTPTATVTDLGTEFGVEVAKSGQTTSHVFRGSVRVLAVAADGQAEGDGRILCENESARVEKRPAARVGVPQIVVTRLAAAPTDFVRDIRKRAMKVFDLADAVAGGDGFSNGRDRGINPVNGKIVLKDVPGYKSEADYPIGDRKYHRVDGLPFVDGVFVPDGGLGPVQTDSAGHRFDNFSATCNRSPGYIWVPGETDLKGGFSDICNLDGINYALPGHHGLLLTSNKAITFDLEAIRKANPGWRVSRFRSMAGNTETLSAKGWSVLADLMVLVDGQERFKRREICAFNGAFPVNIAIHDKDRFLTLASTDADHSVIADWIIFGDPRLELAPAESGPKE